MLQAERHRLICSHVSQHGSALVRDLALLCHVSQETIRRDLTALERENVCSAASAVPLLLNKMKLQY